MYDDSFIRTHKLVELFPYSSNCGSCAYCGEQNRNVWMLCLTSYSPSNVQNPNSLHVSLCENCRKHSRDSEVQPVVLLFAECWLTEHPQLVETSEPEHKMVGYSCGTYPYNEHTTVDETSLEIWLEKREVTEESLIGNRIIDLIEIFPGIVQGPRNSGGPGFRALFTK